MFDRKARLAITGLLQEFPAVAIVGPRQVGKTTLALSLRAAYPDLSLYLDLETPSDLARLQDAEAFFEAHTDRLIILDEIQRAPNLFAVLRGAIDRNERGGRQKGQFLLLGSASGALLAQSSESLAGRLAYAELTPLLACEVVSGGTPESTSAALEQLWIRGGFPRAYLAASAAASLRWRQQFIATYLERDIPTLGPRLPPQALRRLWTMLAHEQGQLLNASKLAASLAMSGQTVARYIDILCDLMLVRRLPPWSRNVGKRLVRSPKVYVRDSGLVHALLGLPTLDTVLGHPVAGPSWEGWVIETLIAAAPSSTEACFYRTAAGAEIDLVMDLPGGERWAVEIKRSRSPVLGPGFRNGVTDVAAHSAFVVHSGREEFALPGGVTALPLTNLVARLRGQSRPGGVP